MDYDRDRYKAWALPHPMILHWVLNPALVINEVLLGQRIPRLTLIDKTSSKPLMERTFIPCPSCKVLHEGRIWAKGRAFGHWFGYVCPDCGGRIPCLWNLTSLLLLAVTLPAWIVPVLLWKDRWLEFEKRRAQDGKFSKPTDWRDVPWMRMGILWWGGAMWLLVGLIPQLVIWGLGRTPYWSLVLISLPICLGGGFLFGLGMKLWMGAKGRPAKA